MWTTPRADWQVNEVVDATDMNAIGENLTALKSPPSVQVNLNESADYTTSATTFVDVDASRLSATLTTNGGDLLVTFCGTLYTSSATSINIGFDIAVDGIRHAGDDGAMLVTVNNVFAANASFVVWIPNLAAGSHTVKLQWKTNSGTAILWAGAGTVGADIHPQFSVREVS